MKAVAIYARIQHLLGDQATHDARAGDDDIGSGFAVHSHLSFVLHLNTEKGRGSRSNNCRDVFRAERDVAVLDDLERNLVLNLFDAEGWRRLVLDDEAPDLVIG